MSDVSTAVEVEKARPTNYLRPDERATQAVHKVFGTAIRDLIEESRFACIARPRHIAVAVTYALMSKPSMSKTGARFGRHHTTALYSICEVSDALKRNDPKWVPEITAVCSIVGIEKERLLRKKTNDARKVRKNKR